MGQWDDYTQQATMAGAKYLVNFSTELRDRLSGQGNELSHDDADYFLRQIIGMAESMRVTVAAGKREGAAWVDHQQLDIELLEIEDNLDNFYDDFHNDDSAL